MEENNTIIKTVGQLKQYFGKEIMCSYGEPVMFKWMFKLQTIDNEEEYSINHPITHLNLCGTNYVVFIDIQSARKTPYVLKDEGYSNAQRTIKLPTQEEIKQYRHVLRYKRIFGHNPK